MKSGKNKRIRMAVLLLVVWGLILLGVGRFYYQMEKTRCFERLNGYVEYMGKTIYQDMSRSEQYLEAMGNILEQEKFSSNEEIIELFAGFKETGIVAGLELLLPGDRMLLDDGSLLDMSGQISFDEEAKGGVHIARHGTVIRQCVPVELEGTVQAVLCGVIDLEQLPDTFLMQEYGQNMQFYIVEGQSGQFLLDTWHDTLGTVEDLRERKAAKGYSREKFHQDFSEGKAGVAVFFSEKARENFYSSYAPVHVGDWMVMVTVPSSAVFSYAENILTAFYTLLMVSLVLFAVYFFRTLHDMEQDKKAHEEKLRIDALTGLMNRNSYHNALEEMQKRKLYSFACIYADVNGLHEINNHLGHQAGDEMLVRTAEALKDNFYTDEVYRIGGDEFVALCQNETRQEICRKVEQVREAVREYGYELSVGMEWRDTQINIPEMIEAAENSMRFNKEQYYKEGGGNRQLRFLNEKMTKLVTQKQDMDIFISTLAPQFKGVYFVDLEKDTVRYLFIPSYFKKMLEEEAGSFRKGLKLYCKRMVEREYKGWFDRCCDYGYLEKKLDKAGALEFRYQKTDGAWMHLKVLRMHDDMESCRETLWIFSNTGRDAGPESGQ